MITQLSKWQNMTWAIVFLFLFGAPLSINATKPPFDTLSGPLPKTIAAQGRPYLIVSDIEVPFGKKVTIEPGVVFMFQNFTGFHVEGQLIAEGTKSRPIVFTSEFDGIYNPDTTLIANPFDWNGIYIHKDAFGSQIKFAKIMYSVYGIKSDTRLIRIDPCIFGNNGKGHLAIADSTHTILENKPYTYVLSKRDATIEGVPIKLISDPLARKRNFFRYASITLLVGGISAGIIGYERYKDSQDKFNTLSTDDQTMLNQHSTEDWDKARTDKYLDFTLLCAGISASVLGTTGFVWTFTF